jgi:peptide/nickel transport system permease protein
MTVRAYALRRLLLLVPTVFAATLLIFVLLRVLPGDVALAILIGADGQGTATPAEVLVLRQTLGTDKPILEQYLRWTAGVVRLDLGKSLWSDESVSDALGRRFPVTLELATLALVGTALIGIPLGVLMAVRQDTWLDYLLRLLTIGGQAFPSFFLGVVLLIVLVRWLNWIPPLEYVPLFADPRRNLLQLALPAAIMAYSGAVVTARLTRSAMLDVLRQEYITSARAKGLRERRVTLGHALKNASLSTFAYLGVLFVGSLNGAVALEVIFSVPGIGSGLVDAVARRDYPMVEGTLLAMVVIVVVANLLIDLMYRLLDPRIRYG